MQVDPAGKPGKPGWGGLPRVGGDDCSSGTCGGCSHGGVLGLALSKGPDFLERNSYHYCSNNPANCIDPMGLRPNCSDFFPFMCKDLMDWDAIVAGFGHCWDEWKDNCEDCCTDYYGEYNPERCRSDLRYQTCNMNCGNGEWSPDL